MNRKGDKIDNKLQVTHQGYATRATKLAEAVQNSINEFNKASVELGNLFGLVIISFFTC